MQLSIIIVNYNVKHFLEQCLCSAQRAIGSIEAEILVVDNRSQDHSIEWLQPAFPSVRFISNTENTGFAKACNQGLLLARGKYILFLNPDTILPEDCFSRCIAFFEARPDAGALGIRMIDGSGKFLKESKRSFPSPLTSLFKLFGLARLFPVSATFSKYHLGHLNEHEDHEVDVLAGAFMLIKKEVLSKTGGFDELFFMYGEDVDLSYRIQEQGYKNYYFSGTSIVHFKGESTRKGSMNYVRMFYAAMSRFVKKHYGGSKAGLFNILVHVAIWIRAAMTALGNFIRQAGLPLIDAGLILLSFWLMKNAWNTQVKTDTNYDNRLLWAAFPVFTLVYMLTAYYAGLYDRWYRRTELLRSTLVATLVVLAGYSLLPEQYRFSRAIILFGALLAFIFISLLRWLLLGTKVLKSRKQKEEHANTLVVGSTAEYAEVFQLMKEAGMEQKLLGRVAVTETDPSAIGYWSKLDTLFQTVPFREVIFCAGAVSFKEIISYLPQLPAHVIAKIHAYGSRSIVGSNSKDSSGEALSKDSLFRLADPYNRRLKRLVDITVSLLALLSFPVHLVFVRKPLRFFSNCLSILLAQKTWVGYTMEEKEFPKLRPAILGCNGMAVAQPPALPAESLQMLDYWYARDYEPLEDLKLITKKYRTLGE